MADFKFGDLQYVRPDIDAFEEKTKEFTQRESGMQKVMTK